MTMPSAETASQKITSPNKKSSQPLINARSSISIPDLTGNTLGNGRYLLAGEAVSSINGRSYIQTAYRASPLGKPSGEPLAIKYSKNQEAMKREYNNYQKVSAGMKRGSFIRRVECRPVAGNEMQAKSIIVTRAVRRDFMVEHPNKPVLPGRCAGRYGHGTAPERCDSLSE